MQTKEALREQARSWRAQLTNHERQLVSRTISDQLESMDWSFVKNLHIYLSIKERNEIDTFNFIHWVLAEHPEITIFTPRYNADTKTIDSIQLTNSSKIANDSHGIPTVQAGQPEVVAFDRIIVPALMTDDAGFRLGYGGGTYDRFLQTQPQAESIALCYASQKISSLPHQSHDYAVSSVLTG